MANRKATLLWYCRTPRGWRRFPAVFGRNGRVRHSFVIDKGREVSYPEGRYEVLVYEGRKAVYKRAGENAADALAARDREANLLIARDTAAAAGAKIVEEEQRKYIRRQAVLYIQDCENRQALVAAEQARLVTGEFMEVTHKTFTDEIKKEDVYLFHKALRKRGCGPRTVANKHARLKSFFKFAGLDTAEVMPPVPKYEETLPTVYTPDELRAILKAADPYMRLMIEMGLMLGLRDQEMVYAEWGDVDWQQSVFRVQGKPHWEFKVKDSEQRDVPIPAELLDRLRKWQKKRPFSKLILGTKKDTPNEKLLRALKRVARNAGLNCGKCGGCKGTPGECQRWTLHKLRRTYGTTLLRSGLDLKTVQHYMGHADLASTIRYLRPASTSETQAKINAIRWA